VNEYVEQILNSSSTNMVGIPDSVERKVYTICLTLLFFHLQHSLQQSKIILFGHEISFPYQKKNVKVLHRKKLKEFNFF